MVAIFWPKLVSGLFEKKWHGGFFLYDLCNLRYVCVHASEQTSVRVCVFSPLNDDDDDRSEINNNDNNNSTYPDCQWHIEIPLSMQALSHRQVPLAGCNCCLSWGGGMPHIRYDNNREHLNQLQHKEIDQCWSIYGWDNSPVYRPINIAFGWNPSFAGI